MTDERQQAAAIATAAALRHRDSLAWVYYHRPQVLHPSRGLVPFRPYDYQVELMDALDAGRHVVVNKARQIGISTTVMMQKVRRCVEEGPVTVVTVSAAEKYAKELIRIARTALAGCDPPSPVPLITDNQLELAWANGSRITAMAASANPGRGFAVSDLVLDEFAYWPWQEEMWRAIRPTIARGRSVAVISTPALEGDLFHQRWAEAGTRRNWRPFELPWTCCPEYGDEWQAAEASDYTAADWAREYECQFGRTADAVFGPEHIARAIELGALPFAASSGRVYAIGGDLAGEGRAETVLIVLDVTERPVRVVDAWSSEEAPAPVIQARIEQLAAQYHARPWLDRTGVGWGIIENLTCPATGVLFTGGSALTGTPKRPNIPASTLINHLVLGLEQEQLAIPEQFAHLLVGLRAYRWKQTQGHKSRCADWVDALSLAWWATAKAPGRARVTTKPRGL